MKERMLVLAKAYPEYSKKHGAIMCTAGITENGDWRRIYPISMNTYIKKKYKKKQWIEYETRKKTHMDFRKESESIREDSIRLLGMETDESVKKMLDEKLTNIEDLKDNHNKDKTSLGVIKPKLNDFFLEKRNISPETEKKIKSQQTLFEDSFRIDILDKRPKYKFNCESSTCKGHNILCEDIEAMMLYRNIKKNDTDQNIIVQKMKNKLFDFMQKRDLYFIMGSHFRFPTFMIISLFYPEKREKQEKNNKQRSLFEFSN